MTRQLVVFGSAVMTTLLGLAVLWQFRVVVALLLISLAVAAALRPITSQLVGKSAVGRAGWIFASLLAAVVLVYGLFLAVESALLETQSLVEAVSAQTEWKQAAWLAGSPYGQALISQLPPPGELFAVGAGEAPQIVPQFVLRLTQGIGRAVSGIFIILILSIYWTVHKTHFERLWLSVLPSGQRKKARGVWRTIEPSIGGYVRSETLLCILAGLLLTLGYWLLGSPYPALLGVAGALAFLVPVVGVVLAALPPLVVGVLDPYPLAPLTAPYALLVLGILTVWVKPRLYRRSWESPLLTLLVMAAMADAFGLVGLVLAPPLSIVMQIMWNRLVGRRQVAGAAALISDLKERQQVVWDAIQGMEEPPLPVVTNILERLSRLIERAEPVLGSELPAALEPESPGLTRVSGANQIEDASPLATKPAGNGG